jgi:hypothetical protein
MFSVTDPTATIVAAVIGLIGTIGGVLAPSMARSLQRRKRTSELLGSWKATWEYDAGGSTQQPHDEDRIELKAVDHERVVGTGRNLRFGDYEIEGRETPFAFTFSYRGTGKQTNLAGVAILKKTDVVGRNMEGRWWQYRDDHSLGGGRVKLVKEVQ